MKREFFAAAVLLALAPMAHAQNLEKTTIAIPAVSFAFTGDYVAEDAGLYKESGLDVEVKFLAGNAGFNAMVSGAVDFSLSSGTNLDRAAARGQKMLAIANMNNLPPWDVVIRKSIADAAHFDPKAPLAERAKILKGRTLVVDGVGSAAHSFLRVIAMAGGIDPELDHGLRLAAARDARSLSARPDRWYFARPALAANPRTARERRGRRRQRIERRSRVADPDRLQHRDHAAAILRRAPLHLPENGPRPRRRQPFRA